MVADEEAADGCQVALARYRLPPHLRVVREVAGGISWICLAVPQIHELLRRQRLENAILLGRGRDAA